MERIIRQQILNFNIQKEIKEKDIMKAIKEAYEQWESAKSYFEEVTEPRLIDYAIFLESAARMRYTFLVEEAREKGIAAEPYACLKEII